MHPTTLDCWENYTLLADGLASCVLGSPASIYIQAVFKMNFNTLYHFYSKNENSIHSMDFSSDTYIYMAMISHHWRFTSSLNHAIEWCLGCGGLRSFYIPVRIKLDCAVCNLSVRIKLLLPLHETGYILTWKLTTVNMTNDLFQAS